ncbi:MAG: GTPase HflX [Cohaesibacteraceae bacterium]
MAKGQNGQTDKPAGKPRFQIEDTRARATRTALIVPDVQSRAGRSNTGNAPLLGVEPRSLDARAQEATGLAAAISLDVVFTEALTVANPRPATLLGSGKVESLAIRFHDEAVELVIVDHELTPIQQRNLERAFKAKVLDRTGLILEIFGRRAQTREGVLQVDLAHLTYQKSRLVRSWTHLERQRGGKGFLGGPGETQIEADRRVIQDKITRLKGQLDEVRRTRTLHRSRRKSVPAPTIALVGYTNAGKSTLFNRLTESAVKAEDLLFATLDPTLRRVRLPKGTEVILSDTVGFISNLPTALIAAFRATLEEVLEADLIVHVRDITNPDTEAQRQDVLDVLDQLGIVDRDGSGDRPILEAWNKVDRLDGDRRLLVERQASTTGPSVMPVSAVSGDGLQALLEAMETSIASTREKAVFDLRPEDGEGRAWLFANATVLDEEVSENGHIRVEVAMTPRRMAHARERFSPMGASADPI